MQTNRKFFSLVIILLIIVALFVGFVIWLNLTLHIVNTSPSLSNVSEIVPYIDVNFNKDLSGTGSSVTVSPNIMRKYTISGKDLRVYLLSMTTNQTYKITITNLHSIGGQKFSKILSFKALNIPFDKLSTSEQKEIIDSQDPSDPSLVTNNGLLAHLPYGEQGYEITGEITTGADNQSELVIKITIDFDAADYAASPQVLQSRVTEREQAAVSYIKSLGYNPANYNIQYVVPTIP